MKLPRPLVLTLLLSVAPLSTATLGIAAAQAGPVPIRIALREGVSDADLKRYAAALIAIEPLRLEALNTIQAQVGGQLPELMCNQPSSMDGLPSAARKVFANYCNRADAIAKKHGLSIGNFNRITQLVAGDPKLQVRLQKQVNCLQGSC
jgi:Domain of unknown function (DUF4168)